MKDEPKRGGLMIALMGKKPSSGYAKDDDDGGDEMNADEIKQEKQDAMQDFINAVKGANVDDAVDAMLRFKAACELAENEDEGL